MPIITVKGHKIDLNIREELEKYSWENERWTDTRLICCSPFRDDSHPSFFVDLESGGWGDSGSYGENASGNFFELIAYLRSTTTSEACNYLLDTCGILYDLTDESKGVHIPTPKLKQATSYRREIEGENLVNAVSPYISTRGISDDVQRKFCIGYGDGIVGYTAIPWYTADGRLANIKYRSTKDKKFFYESNATPVSKLLYGIDLAKEFDYVVIVEGEIDAMSWWTAGIPAVAVGGSFLNGEQAEIIRHQGFDKIYLGGDNDKQGDKLNKIIHKRLQGFGKLYSISYGEENDANDVLTIKGVEGLRTIFDNAIEIKSLSITLHQ